MAVSFWLFLLLLLLTLLVLLMFIGKCFKICISRDFKVKLFFPFFYPKDFGNKSVKLITKWGK